MLIPVVKHEAVSVIVWGSLARTGPVQLAIIETNMNSTIFQKLMGEIFRHSEKI